MDSHIELNALTLARTSNFTILERTWGRGGGGDTNRAISLLIVIELRNKVQEISNPNVRFFLR